MKVIQPKYVCLVILILSMSALGCVCGVPPSNGNGNGSSSVIEISTVAELQSIGVDPAFPVDGHYLLVNDLDLGDVANFDPIPTVENQLGQRRFEGRFDGGGHTLYNLTIDRPDEEHVGLFAEFYPGFLNDLVIRDASVTGGSLVGVVVGTLSTGGLEDVHVIDSTVVGTSAVGGLTGEVAESNAYIRSSSVRGGSVTGASSLGGFAGSLVGTIEDGFTDTTVVALGDPDHNPVHDVEAVGGFAGHIAGGRTVVERCEAHGDVTIDGTSVRFVGGFAGHVFLGATIRDAAAHGSVSATGSVASMEGIGGFVGQVAVEATIRNTFARGSLVEAAPDDVIGGFAGISREVEVDDSVFDREAAAPFVGPPFGEIEDTGGTGAASLTTDEMQSMDTYTVHRSWDFDSVWDLDGTTADGYPFIRTLH